MLFYDITKILTIIFLGGNKFAVFILEIKSQQKINDAAARIVCRIKIAVSRTRAEFAESASAAPGRRQIGSESAHAEIGFIQSIENVHMYFKVAFFVKHKSLCHTYVEFKETRSV